MVSNQFDRTVNYILRLSKESWKIRNKLLIFYITLCLKLLFYCDSESETEAFTFNFSEQAAFVCLMMRQRSENVLEFTLGNYFLD